METMKVGKNYIDFYQGKSTFYELDLSVVRTDNRDLWIDHMCRKCWFMQQNMLFGFQQAIDNWLATGDARKSS